VLEKLELATLSKLDHGKVAEAFRMHLKRAAEDCTDRPGDGKTRMVVLEIGLVPVLDESGDCYEVQAQCQVKSKVPAHKTKVLSLGARMNGLLVFNPESPDAVDQGTLDLPDND
jgi:hypothetical protein